MVARGRRSTTNAQEDWDGFEGLRPVTFKPRRKGDDADLLGGLGDVDEAATARRAAAREVGHVHVALRVNLKSTATHLCTAWTAYPSDPATGLTMRRSTDPNRFTTIATEARVRLVLQLFHFDVP